MLAYKEKNTAFFPFYENTEQPTNSGAEQN